MGLRRPPQNGDWKPQMKIAACFDFLADCPAYVIIRPIFKPGKIPRGSHQKNVRILGVAPRIYIFYPERNSDDIYATTIHELAHASHWELRKNRWAEALLSRKVVESWAMGVEWELTRMKFPEYEGGGRRTDDYTLVVADMIDDSTTDSTNHGFWTPEDSVSGYTIKEIEGTLHNSSTWNEWRDNIKNSYTNDTENHLDTLFRYYE